MAVLTSDQRIVVEKRVMERLSTIRESCAITKTELAAAVAGVDDWLHANVAAFNSSIPQPARANLTPSQKAHLLSAIALMWHKDRDA